MWVGFLHTVVTRWLLMSRCTSVSRNAICLLFSTSMVKWIVCCCEFMCKRSLLTVDLVVTMKVSSMYLFQIRGTYSGGHDLRSCYSKFSNISLAMIAKLDFPVYSRIQKTNPLNKMTNHRSTISKATSKAYMNSTHNN